MTDSDSPTYSSLIAPPFSPIVDGFINNANSEGVSQGFISSTPLIMVPTSPSLLNKGSFAAKTTYNSNKNIKRARNEENSDEITILKDIRQQMKNLEDKIDKIGSSVKNMQDELAEFKNEVRSRQLADNKLSRKTFCTCEMIKRKINKIVSDDTADDELNLLLPVESMAALSDLEAKVVDESFKSKMVSFLKLKKIKIGFDGIFRCVAKDDIYFQFNLDGRCKKRSLLSLNIFKEILFQASPDLTRKEYEHDLRKSILKAHNRFNKMNSLAKNKDKLSGSEAIANRI